MAAKFHFILACAVMVSGCAGPGPAAESSSPQSLGETAAAPQRPAKNSKYSVKEKDGVKLYCIDEKELGSRARVTRQCLTEAEWREVQDLTRREMRRPSTPPNN